MMIPDWTKEFPASIEICDKNGQLIYLNDKALKIFEKDGGDKLIGTDIKACHPEESRNKLEQMLKDGSANCYIVAKKEMKKFVYQAPWFRDGEYMGLVEMIIEIPQDIRIKKVEE
jgi:DUF438 domain-containing protein